ncbi:carcinoembryonic antigen-related cell adhesion molecule 1-like isoform X4 [Ctenopharyngodon idella]|uniref:carcinoembryonic antigen-related cell adhesion molecule 1-like isoform X4 n=1 Tax=Ctenopharyngodon idella TaxID=7959 RepID=UPI00222E270B|nr:carcinoembryonic antigen-related cell adhesion molecule 1-like isoform X4 [Ctenopharyngodon idella]
MGVLFIFLSVGSFLLYQGTSGVDTDRVSVMEGDSVTLHTGVKKTQEDSMKWYFKDIRIAQINGDSSKTCTDVQCKDSDERFRGRLKLDHQTGSLTITNITNTDSGEYTLKISGGSGHEKIFSVTVHDKVSVMEGDSVTLHTDVKKTQQDGMKWYFNDIRIAQISGDLSKICTDVQCKDGDERFRDRLNLDHQTGSLTITNTRNTDSGVYQLKISSGSDRSGHEKIFSVTVHGVSAAERDEMKKKVKEGESVTLDPHVMKTPNVVMTWYFNDILITEITGDQSKICTDDQCEERFRDRLKLDHQTGSLTITNTRNTDSGEYKLEITSRSSLRRRRSISISSVKSFSVSVIDSGLSSGAVAGIVVVAVVVLLLVFVAAAAGVIYRRHRIVRNDMGEKEQGVIEENPSTRSLMTGEKTEVI